MDKSLLPSYEIWNWIKGYEGRFEISNRGRIRSWVKKGGGNRKNKGTIRFNSTPLIKKTHPTQWGYYSTHIGNDSLGDVKSVRVHREVGIMFIPNPLNLPEVNHKWGRKWQNEWFNLRWDTRLDNIAHAFETGLIVPAVGEQQSNTKLKNEEVIYIFNSTKKTKELMDEFGVAADAILDIKRGRTWGHLTGKIRNPKIEKLKPEYILEIFNFNGTAAEAATNFNRSYSLCRAIKDGREYSNITGKIFERQNKEAVKPTADLVLKIYNCPFDTKEVARLYNVSDSFVKNIKSGKKYLEITKHKK